MGPPNGTLRECQPGSPRFPYRRMSNPLHHAQACVGSALGQRDPLQLVEHSGDAAGIVPAVADVPGRTPLHHLYCLRVVMCVGVPYDGGIFQLIIIIYFI